MRFVEDMECPTPDYAYQLAFLSTETQQELSLLLRFNVRLQEVVTQMLLFDREILVEEEPVLDDHVFVD